MPIRYDDINSLGKFEKTPQGYLKIPVAIGKADCVLTYKRHDGTEVKEFRPKSEVMAENSLKTASYAPLTVGHKADITPENTNKYGVGHLGETVREDGDLAVGTAIVTHWKTISQIERKKLVDVSPGYKVDIVEQAGEFNGQRYDRIQTNIRLNHVALLPKGQGRQGSDVCMRLDSGDEQIENDSNKQSEEKHMKFTIRLDGKDYTFDTDDEKAQDAIRKTVERLDSVEKDNEKLSGQLAIANSKVKEEKTRADKAEEKEKERVRQDAINKLILINPEVKREDLEKKTLKEVRLDAIEAAGFDRNKFDGKSDGVVEGAFSVLEIPKTEKKKDSLKAVGGTLPKTVTKKEEIKEDSVTNAIDDMNKNLENAWKGGN